MDISTIQNKKKKSRDRRPVRGRGEEKTAAHDRKFLGEKGRKKGKREKKKKGKGGKTTVCLSHWSVPPPPCAKRKRKKKGGKGGRKKPSPFAIIHRKKRGEKRKGEKGKKEGIGRKEPRLYGHKSKFYFN